MPLLGQMATVLLAQVPPSFEALALCLKVCFTVLFVAVVVIQGSNA